MRLSGIKPTILPSVNGEPGSKRDENSIVNRGRPVRRHVRLLPAGASGPHRQRERRRLQGLWPSDDDNPGSSGANNRKGEINSFGGVGEQPERPGIAYPET